MKITKLLLPCFILAFGALSAQTVNLKAYDLEVKEVLQKKTIGTLSPDKGNKYIGIEVVITALSQDHQDFDLSNLKIKSTDGQLEGDFIKRSSRYPTIDVSKPRARMLFAQIDKAFTSGDLYYDGEKVGSIELNQNNKKGEFMIAKK